MFFYSFFLKCIFCKCTRLSPLPKSIRKEEKAAYHSYVWRGLKDGDFTHGEFHTQVVLNFQSQTLNVISRLITLLKSLGKIGYQNGPFITLIRRLMISSLLFIIIITILYFSFQGDICNFYDDLQYSLNVVTSSRLAC